MRRLEQVLAEVVAMQPSVASERLPDVLAEIEAIEGILDQLSDDQAVYLQGTADNNSGELTGLIGFALMVVPTQFGLIVLAAGLAIGLLHRFVVQPVRRLAPHNMTLLERHLTFGVLAL